MVKGLFIPAEASAHLEIRDYRRLEDYQSAVGGWIEAVDVHPLGVTMLVNENGIAERLPFNGRATFLWWFHSSRAREHAALVGDVAVVGLPDNDGEPTDVPSTTMDLLTSSVPHVVTMRIDGEWCANRTVNRDYWEAIHWAMIKLSREPELEDVNVVRAAHAGQYPLRPIPPLPTHGSN